MPLSTRPLWTGLDSLEHLLQVEEGDWVHRRRDGRDECSSNQVVRGHKVGRHCPGSQSSEDGREGGREKREDRERGGREGEKEGGGGRGERRGRKRERGVRGGKEGGKE